MKALTWHGKGDIRCETVPDPKIEHPATRSSRSRPARSAAPTCISIDGMIPDMKNGDVLGHETMGEVVEVGAGVQQAQGRRPGRGAVHHLLWRMLLLQARAFTPAANGPIPITRRRRSFGAIPRRGCSAIRICWAAIAGGQAEYLRVPFADVGPIKVPDGL